MRARYRRARQRARTHSTSTKIAHQTPTTVHGGDAATTQLRETPQPSPRSRTLLAPNDSATANAGANAADAHRSAITIIGDSVNGNAIITANGGDDAYNHSLIRQAVMRRDIDEVVIRRIFSRVTVSADDDDGQSNSGDASSSSIANRGPGINDTGGMRKIGGTAGKNRQTKLPPPLPPLPPLPFSSTFLPLPPLPTLIKHSFVADKEPCDMGGSHRYVYQNIRAASIAASMAAATIAAPRACIADSNDKQPNDSDDDSLLSSQTTDAPSLKTPPLPSPLAAAIEARNRWPCKLMGKILFGFFVLQVFSFHGCALTSLPFQCLSLVIRLYICTHRWQQCHPLAKMHESRLQHRQR